VVDEAFVLSIPANLELAKAAPLLCAGITTYSPLKYWKVTSGMKVGVIGLGGLGHMAVKLAKAMGAQVVLFTTSENKIQDGLKLGAKEVILSTNLKEMKTRASSLDLIINTVAAKISLSQYLNLLKKEGTMVMLGVSPEALALEAHSLIMNRRNLAGSLIGGLKETKRCLIFVPNIISLLILSLFPFKKLTKPMREQSKHKLNIDL
jgi:uncharacterized zinc-type alcohol dehydrogenase-like protein